MRIDNRNSVFDVLRLLLAIVVVGIHARVFAVGWGYPLCRLAVPLFFILSAYFLYNKIDCGLDGGVAAIRRFVKRNWMLYAFWVIVLLPYFLYVYKQRWFGRGWLGCYDSLKRIFVIGVQSYWFIIAGIVAMVISYVILKYLGEKTLWCISIMGYLAAVVSSSHCYLMDDIPVVRELYDYFVLVYERPEFTFIGALIWISTGMWFARWQEESSVISLSCVVLDILLCLFAIALLLAEASYVRRKTGMGTCDVYAALPFAVWSVFRIVSRLKINLQNLRICRDLSVALYMMHAPIIAVFVFAAKHCGLNAYGGITFCGTLLVCLMIFFIIRHLKDTMRWFWLKYTW